MKTILACVFSLISAAYVQASSLEQSSVKISPTGQYLAVKTQRYGKATLSFLDRKTLDVLGGLAMKGQREVGEFYWANDNRVVSEIHHISQAKPSTYHGELFAINFDGSQKRLIQDLQTGNNRLKVVDPLPENDGHVLVSTKPLHADNLSDEQTRGIATLLNIYQGIEQAEIEFHADTLAGFYIDDVGELQVASTNSETEQLHISDNK